MSQQELFPEPQEQANDEAAHMQPFYRAQSRQRRTGNLPKEEHPATFETFSPPYETGYRPSTQSHAQQYVPLWARPQRHKRSHIWRWLSIAVLVLVLVKALPFLLTLVGIVLGIAALAILLPLLIIVGILLAIAVVVLGVLALLGISFRHGGFHVWTGRR